VSGHRRDSEANLRLRRPERAHLFAMTCAVVFGMGAVVGDIGSCGQSADELDARTFFELKANDDCIRCGECGLVSTLCEQACTQASASAFAENCRPLVHDGEVCLRALTHASCDDYASYMNDAAPTAPSECQFCPSR
jgi:hypothetical protein